MHASRKHDSSKAHTLSPQTDVDAAGLDARQAEWVAGVPRIVRTAHL